MLSQQTAGKWGEIFSNSTPPMCSQSISPTTGWTAERQLFAGRGNLVCQFEREVEKGEKHQNGELLFKLPKSTLVFGSSLERQWGAGTDEDRGW